MTTDPTATPRRRGSGFCRRFLTAAEEQLDPELFARLSAFVEEAIQQEHKPQRVQVDRSQPEPVPVPIETKRVSDRTAVAARLSAALNNRPSPQQIIPHSVERLAERFAIEVGPKEVAELTQLILRGGPNVTKIKRELRAVDHYRVIWRGVEFVAVLAVDRNHLVTVHAASRRKPAKLQADPTRRTHPQRLTVRDIVGEGEALV